MTLVPALAEAQAAHIERMKRMGVYRQNVVPMARVRVVEPEPEPKPIVAIPALPDARDWLHIASPTLNPVSTKIVISVVAKSYGVAPMEIVSRRKHAAIFMPRAVVCWILRNHARLSLPQIGARLGGRDHTTILHATRKIDQLRERDPEFAERIDELVSVSRALDDRWRSAA